MFAQYYDNMIDQKKWDMFMVSSVVAGFEPPLLGV